MSAGSASSPVVDFSSLDFESIKTDLIAFAQNRYPELWTDFNAANFGIVILEALAYASDLLSYNGNAQVLEAIVTTMVREQNFRNAAKAFDYSLHSATPSSTVERVFLDAGETYPFTLSKHLQFSDASGIVFQPDGDTVVAAYPVAGYVDVPVTQGEEHYQENIGTTNGRAGQQLTLGSSPLIDNTLTVLIGAQPYTLVRNTIAYGPTEKIFTGATDENGVTTLTFGDGVNGAIPPSGQIVYATYKTGGGTETNLPKETIDQVIGTSDGSAVPPHIVSVLNTVKATDGGPKQSLLSGKRNLPRSLKANERCVTHEDYATEAVRLVPGVLKASGVAGTYTAGGRPVLLFVVPQGGGDPSPTLVNQIGTALRPEKMGGKRVVVLPARYVDLQIEVDAFVLPTASKATTAGLVRAILEARFPIEQNEFGGDEDLELQGTYEAINPKNNSIDGLKRATIRKFTIRPHFGRYVNVPTIGNWDFTDEAVIVTNDVQRREWAITVTTVGSFVVRQRQLGVLSGVTNTILTDDAAHFTPNVLAEEGWVFHVRPDEQDVTLPIVANGETSVTISGDALLLCAVDDAYVVERLEPLVGTIARTQPTSSALAGQPTVNVGSTTGFLAGNRVLVTEGSQQAVMVVQSALVGSLTFTENLPFALTTAGTVDWYWQSEDGTVGFALRNGTSSFQSGDRLYVDTYPRVGDIRVRAENFPVLSDLDVNPIGGT